MYMTELGNNHVYDDGPTTVKHIRKSTCNPECNHAKIDVGGAVFARCTYYISLSPKVVIISVDWSNSIVIGSYVVNRTVNQDDAPYAENVDFNDYAAKS